MIKSSPAVNIDAVKQLNTASVYQLIDENKLVSRVELAKLSALAPASITKITRQLLAAGLIKEVEQQASTGGRPAISLTCEVDSLVFLSCKLGRNNIVVAQHDIAGKELNSIRTSIPEKTGEKVIELLITQIEEVIATSVTSTLIAIAVTSPGLIDRDTGTLVYSPKHGLKDVPLTQILQAHFNVPSYIGNHTQSLSLAELYFGAAQDCQDSILLSVHNGVGSGIINHRKIFTNFNNQVGEIGHFKIDPLGRLCHCGNHGCLETIASNEAIIKQVRDHITEGHQSTLNSRELTIEKICQAANEGDRLATLVLEQASRTLGQAIAIMVNLFNPQKLLIKGEIVAAKEIVFPAIKQSVAQYTLPGFLPDLIIQEAQFQHAPSMAGVALVRKALFEGSLLDQMLKRV